TRSAPGRPKIDDDDFAAVGARPDRGSAAVGRERKLGRGGSDELTAVFRLCLAHRAAARSQRGERDERDEPKQKAARHFVFLPFSSGHPSSSSHLFIVSGSS